MSRIGQKNIMIPHGVTVGLSGSDVTVKGPKGELHMVIHHAIKVVMADDSIVVDKKHNAQIAQSMWGTTARLIENMIMGVTEGFQKQLELSGVGFRMAIKGKTIEMALGFSHPVIVDIPDGITTTIEGPVMTIVGVDKQAVGQFAANIRALKPVEPYKGKGFKYVGEIVRRKEGKKSAA